MKKKDDYMFKLEKNISLILEFSEYMCNVFPFSSGETDSSEYMSSADANQNWKMLLDGIDVVLHLASPKAANKPSQKQKQDRRMHLAWTWVV